MEIEAKPTEYAGVLFRSKLEATWARFFDVIQLDWEYEPCQIAGWIPDFLLDGWWLAEVKPMQLVEGSEVLRTPFAKAVRSFDTVLLGDKPTAALGLVVRRIEGGGVYSRHLLVNIEEGPAQLHPVPRWPTGFDCPLPQIWRGVVESAETWREAPVRKVVRTAADAFVSFGEVA